jgi:hypothetical protein
MPEPKTRRWSPFLLLALVALVAVGGAVGWYIWSGTRDARATAAFAEYASLRSAADRERQLADNCAREAARAKTLAEREPKRLDLPAAEAERRARVLLAEGESHTRHAEELDAQADELRRRWGSVWEHLGYQFPAGEEPQP